jgi:hypothetical protein
VRGSYDRSLRLGSAGSELSRSNLLEVPILNVSDGNASQSKVDQSKVVKMALGGLAPMTEQNGSFADRTAVWTVARTLAMSERCLPATEGFHPVTTSAQGAAAMPNSRLRNSIGDFGHRERRSGILKTKESDYQR